MVDEPVYDASVPKEERRVQAVLALWRGESVRQVAQHYHISRSDRLLATFGDAIRMTTEARRIEEFSLSNNVVSPSHLCTGKRCKTSKPPRFTKSGQEPTFMANGLQTTLRAQRHCKHL